MPTTEQIPVQKNSWVFGLFSSYSKSSDRIYGKEITWDSYLPLQLYDHMILNLSEPT